MLCTTGESVLQERVVYYRTECVLYTIVGDTNENAYGGRNAWNYAGMTKETRQVSVLCVCVCVCVRARIT